jgi:hypothetical protein
MNIELIIPARLAFSDDMVTPKSVAGGKPRFGAQLIVDAPEKARIAKAVKDIADSEFAGKIPPGKDCCFRNGDDNISAKTSEVYDGFADHWYISANRAETQGPPLVLSNRADPATKKPRIIIDPAITGTMDSDALRAYVAAGKRDRDYPQAGDYVNVKVSLFSLNGKNDKKGNAAYGRKICAQLEVVQFKAKGTPFGASKPSADDFEALPEEEDAMLA